MIERIRRLKFVWDVFTMGSPFLISNNAIIMDIQFLLKVAYRHDTRLE